MSERDDSIPARLTRGLIAGVIAGAVASFAMDRFQAATSSLLPKSGDDSEPATEKAADAVAQALVGHAVPDADKPLAGQAIHYALGIGLGVAYATAAEFAPSVAAGRGAAFGLATATLLDEGVVPAVGLGSPPWRSTLPLNLYSYASHLVFAGVADAVRRQVATTLVA